MAMSLVPFQSIAVRGSAARGHRKPETRRGSPSCWWTPLFGWSSEPDYIHSEGNGKAKGESDSNLDPKPARSRFAPGGFTEEKARRLRMMTTDTASIHDPMYHSAIASRLASDFSNLSGR
ncbi:uncharacterized protein LOC127806589 [Diospyros lotus]|uniref:uncharacterized protein LOC127806589 n=1 Tax=Diospyros lotus TaxID=55363 RepID=UPI002259CEE7|nr:uncharacterized protein LOC127806589 [Diospyros lotus]